MERRGHEEGMGKKKYGRGEKKKEERSERGEKDRAAEGIIRGVEI